MRRLKSSLVWKLTVWFLLLSFLPLAVMTIFVRQTVSDTFADLAADDTRSQAKLLAIEVSTSIDERQVQPILADFRNGTQLAFLLGEKGKYVNHSDEAKVGLSVFDDFSAEVAEKLVAGGDVDVVQSAAGQLIGFSSVPGAFYTAVLVVDGSVVSSPVARIERAAIIQLAVSLALISIAGGIVIWFVFKPIQKLTRAAEELGAGNLEVQIDPSEMEGELEVLTLAFNDMARQLRGAHDDLEQIVESRTEELRESEERYRALFEESRDPIFISLHGKIVAANQSGLEAFGLTREEAIDSDVGDRFVDPEDRERFRREMANVGYVADFEVKLLKKDGQIIDCLLTASSRQNPDGSVGEVQGIARDVTERKKDEETLLQQTRDLAVLEERNRMAREIHDTLAQGFTGIFLQLEAGEQALEESPDEVANHLNQAKTLARYSLQEARRSVWDLLPHALEDRSLELALREEVERLSAANQEKASFDLIGSPSALSSDIQTALLRICQESLTNIKKHADATEVSVTLTFGPESVDLNVKDNGRGFDAGSPNEASNQGGFGLTGMQQRAESVGGNLIVKSHQGKGTQIEVRIPKE